MLARQIAIGFGIAAIFPLLIYYGVSTFYPQPKYFSYITVNAIPPNNPTAEQRQEYEAKRNEMRKQQQAYSVAAKDFARILVLFSTPLGIAAILIGAHLKLYAIGTGLILGGICSVAWGYWGYWSYLDDWIRFVSLLLGLIILLFVGYRRTGLSHAGP